MANSALNSTCPEFAAGTQTHLSWTGAGKTNHLDEAIDPQKKWNVLLVPHIHLDIGYSDYQAKVAAIQDRAVDEAMDFTKQVPDFRYSTDGSWVLDQFMQTRSAPDRDRLIAAMRNQQIFVPAEYANLLTGFPTDGDVDPVAILQRELQPRARHALQLCEHHRRSFVRMVVCFGAGCGGD